MSLTTDVPEVVVKPGKMLSYWTSRWKGAALLLALVLYVYFLLFIKTVYLKSKRLDRIMAMALETEKLMHNVHSADQNLAMKMGQLDDFYEDY